MGQRPTISGLPSGDPVGSLITAARDITNDLILAAGTQDAPRPDSGWCSGFNVEFDGCSTPFCWPACPTGSEDPKPDTGNPQTWVEVEPETIGNTYSSSLFCRANGYEARFDAARGQFLNARSALLEQFAWSGGPSAEPADGTDSCAAGTQHLTNGAARILNPDGPVPWSWVVPTLSAGIASCHRGTGTMHMPLWLGEYIAQASNAVALQNGRYLTQLRGHTLIAGAGYPGTAPDGSDPEPGTLWVYGTGPVMYALGTAFDPASVGLHGAILPPQQITSSGQNITGATNTETIRVEADAAVVWDPCCHLALQVCLPDDCCPETTP